MNAGKYEGIDPGLTRRFRELAAWHARRAREFQRMNPGDVARESERDLELDIEEGRLRERALRYDSILRKRQSEATEEAERHGSEARAATRRGGASPAPLARYRMMMNSAGLTEVDEVLEPPTTCTSAGGGGGGWPPHSAYCRRR